MLIAQITDLHIRLPGQKAYRIVETDAYLPPAVRALNRLDPAPDLVVVSGDLTDFGRPAEYAHLKKMLDALRMPYVLLPGNHDDRGALREVFADHPYLAGAEVDGFMQYAVEDFPVRVLALDTVVPRQSHGSLCARRLAWLADRLDEQPRRPTVIVMHHPPFETGIAHMDAIGLLEGREALAEVVGRHANVERILCGHLHRTIFRRYAGTIASTCPSPAHQVVLDLRPDGPSAFVMEPPGFHLHEWRNGALVSHVAVIGDYAGPYPFHEDGALIDE
ncbi:phosphodiesterase [Bordetella genomosp. 10]|uniref:Phosphodiesterase n=1 Tax=Bordetella genomosp. 10 TaxID=1416804 RepID=A0A261S5N8_9BORD|nr:phosphodiesterase [Bordetella genomosp. 10]OZI32282.1 phosphodiesterase [Bordetella genomosp. 10]